MWLDHLECGGESRRESVFSFLKRIKMQSVTTVAIPLRTRVYIDGYNLYYGCLKGTAHKWLDLHVLFDKHILPSILFCQNKQPVQMQLLPLSIKYFTAVIVERAAKALDSVSCQASYHSALRKLYTNQIEIIEGYYSVTEASAKVIDPNLPNRWPRDCESCQVWKLEEKQTDVNLALQAYHDSITGDVDQVVFVTNDTDIAPALKMIRQHTSVIVGLVIPTIDHQRIPNAELAGLAHWIRSHIRSEELAKSQLPRVIQGRRPTIKPMSWYARPDLLNRILNLAIPITGSRQAAFKWMENSNPYLEGAKPIDLADTDQGAALVFDYIQQWKNMQALKK